MNTKQKIFQVGGASVLASLLLLCTNAYAQINTGSNGSDGALDFSGITMTTNIVINMTDHPNGIYQFTYVNIPTNVMVSFIPNANNTPVYWLVQNDVTINGTVSVAGHFPTGTPYPSMPPNYAVGGIGGPGGGAGGNGGSDPTAGLGLGGGIEGGGGGFGTQGDPKYGGAGGAIYGNSYLLPLMGGSGGGGIGGNYQSGGGGGGGAILIATSGSITLNGTIDAQGSTGFYSGGGSGGGVRLVCSIFSGTGSILAGGNTDGGGSGRVRTDVVQSNFGGRITGVFTQGSQFIILPTSGQLPHLIITSVGGVPVSASPTGQIVTPDAVISAQQNNPVPIVVVCANLPLHSLITVSVKPANGSPVSATGYNDIGTLSSSTATISINIPRGGGLIYAAAATGN